MSDVTHCLIPGQKIGAYEVVRPLGEGSMGEVYEVIDHTLDRQAALKVVPPSLAGDKLTLARFRREVVAACQVRHPGVVHIFDYGVLPEQGLPYFVMEYLEGETLHSRFWRATRQLEGRVGLACLEPLRQIALALDAVHRHGLVHRDLKPSNVMLVPDSTAPGGERAKLLDFGIVKILQGGGHLPDDSTDGVTRQGAVLGTPRYMAPEQWQCRPNIDGKADVYALGVMTFFGLSGQLPFVATDSLAFGLKHCYKRPPSLARMAPDTPPELVELVERMLKKEPVQRPTMLEVAEVFERYISQKDELQESAAERALAFGSASTLPGSATSLTGGELLAEALAEEPTGEYESIEIENAPETRPEPSALELTQPLLAVAQRSTMKLPPVEMTSRLPIDRSMIEAPHLLESSENSLLASSGDFKVDNRGAWVAKSAALTLLVCAVGIVFGMHPAHRAQNMITAAVAVPEVLAPTTPQRPAPQLYVPPTAQSGGSEPAPAQLEKRMFRVRPDATCIRSTNWSTEQQLELLRVLSRSNTKLYPKEQLLILSVDDKPQLKHVPRSMSGHMRANLVAELARSRARLAAAAPAYLPDLGARHIEVRCTHRVR